MPSAHAILAPSASKRWIACSPSARLEQMLPNKETSYAYEGTQAHSIAEKLLTNLRDDQLAYTPDETVFSLMKDSIDFQNEIAACEELGVDFNEMYETVADGYAKIVYEEYLKMKQEDPDTILIVEAELKLTDYIPEGFGSSDAVIIGNRELCVFDLKYGKGVQVSAKGNPQMSCYALGAYCGPCELYDIDTVRMTIIQPRLNWVSSSKVPLDSLLTWGRVVLKPAAEKAFKGEGDLCAGEHCKFCNAAALCPALKEKAIVASTIPADLMTNEELGEALNEAESVEIWLKALKDYSLNLALEGEKIPGWKIVEGRSLRTIQDKEAAEKALKDAGFEPSDYNKPAELKTITDLEKLLTKKGFQTLLGDLVVKPQGKPTLAHADDKRPEFSSASSDFKDLM